MQSGKLSVRSTAGTSGTVPETEAERLKGSLQAAEQALDALPDDLRQLMRLRYLDGCTIEQTAQPLYFSVNTVNRMQRKAFALLGM